MTDKHSTVISAFHDNEAVDVDSLAAALDDSAARALLLDLVRLSEAVRREVNPLPPSLASLQSRRFRLLSARVPLPIAAAVALIAAVLSLTLSRQLATTNPAPPTPTHTVRFEPGVDWQLTP